MSFTISNTVDKNKVFILNNTELEGKFEVSYYVPEIKSLEDKIRQKTSKKLSDFIVKLSSGATPSVVEIEKFYSDKENGIPFLRVQNLQPNGKLNIEDVKYINKETHKNYLKRSQVAEGDLLIKITGVGRMAVASVAPKGFIGNTNQHMVVIKTKSGQESEYLANYLNLDIVERLAKRRATGGTRPALDYPALKSIPIIENLDFSILDKAEILKQQKEIHAKKLLATIDSYLLNELGIILPEKESSLQSRIFTTKFSEVSGGRFDAVSNKSKELEDALFNGKYSTTKLSKIVKGIKTGTTPHNSLNPYVDLGIPFLRNSNLQKGELDLSEIKYIKEELANQLTYSKKDEIIVCIAGTVGESVINTSIKPLAINQNITALEVDKKMIDIKYLNYFLNTALNIELTKRLCSIATILYLNNSNLLSLNIPFPPLTKQTEIANHIHKIHLQVKKLQTEATLVFEKAKKEIEKIILG